MSRRLAALALLLLLAPRMAFAHAIGVSRGEYRVDRDGLELELTFARGELARLVPSADRNGDGTLDAREIGGAGPSLARAVFQGVGVRAGAACARESGTAEPTEADGVRVRARYRCPEATGRLSVELASLFASLPFGHRHSVHAEANAVALDDVCFRGHTSFAVARAGTDGRPLYAFGRMGVEHILTGYDHLLFLFALVLTAASLRSLVGTISAFTLAHSLTLAVASFGWWIPPARVVEPAIALSIAYVGIENLLMRPGRARWRVPFLFGLIHGFGFASALREIGLSRERLLPAVLAFNVGVECGQLLLVLLAVPGLAWLRRRGSLSAPALRLVNALVVAVGLGWFLERALG